MKRTWFGRLTNVGTRLVHHYTGNTCTGAEYVVYVSGKLDRESDRTITLDMTPESARHWAKVLTEYAEAAEQRNKR